MIDARALEQAAIEVACRRRFPRSVRAAVVALCACWALSSGCAARPATWRSVADRRWLELRSESFIMATDLPRLTALERLRELEDVHRTLVGIFATVAPGPRPHVQPFHIVHLAQCSDLAETSQRTVAGIVTEARDFSGTRLMVTCDSTHELRAALIHEMTHALTAANFTQLRPWLVEGLARYYQTLRVEPTSVVIGKPPPNHLFSDVRRVGNPNSMSQVRYSGPPDLERLTSMTDTFYKGSVYYNYVGAWMLVHLLNSPPHRVRFVAYLRSLHAGTGPDDAWRAAFGDIAGGGIAAQYENYPKRMAIDHYRIRRTSRAAFRDPEVQALRPGEVHALWVRLYMAGKSGTDNVARNAVREHLSSMAREDPEWTGVPFWRAVQAYYGEGDRVQAEQQLRAYAARVRDVRAWVGLVRIGMDRATPPDHLGVGGAVPAGLAAVEPDVRELLRSAGTANALGLVGWYYALRRLSRTGLAFAYRSVRADPTCGACHDTLALLLYQDGRLADAVAAQERAVALMVDERPSRDVERRLELYRRALRNQADASR